MNSVTASASAYISLSLSISPPTRKARSKFQLGKCKPLISSNFDCKCRALGEGSQPETQSQTIQPTIYQGVYGPWTIEDSDIREVILYRSGLVTAAASFVLASSAALLPNDSVMSNLIEKNLDLFYAIGSCGLGLSLFLIHIYVTEIKRSLQALWFLGAIGSLATYSTLAHPAGMNLVQYVIENPIAVWFVGPLFASLTGLVFKEDFAMESWKLVF